MAETHSLGRLYVTRMKYLTRKGMPLLERGWTTEIDHPWRRGLGICARLPLTRLGLVVGWWFDQGSEETNLRIAIEARDWVATNEDALLEWEAELCG